MKISFKKQDMINALSIVTKALPDKTPSPILECIVIEAKNKKIILTATDQYITISTQAIGLIDEEGSVAINGKKLDTIIRKMPDIDKDIVLNVNKDNYCIFTYGNNGEQNIQGSSIENFPKIININKKEPVFVTEYIFKKLIERTLFAVSRDTKEDKKILTGMYLLVEKNKIVLKGIDNFKIAIVRHELRDKYDKKESIVPRNTMEQLTKIIKGDIEKEVKIYFNDKVIMFEVDNSIIISNIIEGSYLNTDKIINTEYSTKVKVDKNELYESIDRTCTYLNETNKKPVILDIKNNKMEVRIESMEGGVKDNIDIEKTGNDLMIAFNQNTFLSVLNVIDDKNINIFMTTHKHPAFIKDEKETYFYFLLPTSF